MSSLLHKIESTFGEAALVRRSINCFENRVNERQNYLLDPCVSDQMTINLYRFSSLMEHWILCDIDSILVITKHKHRSKLSKTKLQQHVLQPHHLTSSMSHSSILNLCTGSRNILLFAPPCYQISSNRCVIASSGLSISLVTNIASVRIAKNVNMFMLLVQQTFSIRAFDIGKNPQSSCPMNLSRLMHKPTQCSNCKCYIRLSNCQVDQLPNQPPILSRVVKKITITP